MVVSLCLFSLILIAVFAVTTLTRCYVDYSIHKDMVNKYCEVYSYGTYKEFLHQFNSNLDKFKKDPLFPESFLSRFPYNDSEYYIHAGIVRFQGVGFVFRNMLDYIKFQKFLRDNRLISIKEKQINYTWKM